MNINIAIDFSITPGGRFIKEGQFSGEEFRISMLEPKYDEAISRNEKLVIDFDGCFGYATSFLEESFGGLVRVKKKKGILNHIEIISKDDASIHKLIKEYVQKEENKLK